MNVILKNFSTQLLAGVGKSMLASLFVGGASLVGGLSANAQTVGDGTKIAALQPRMVSVGASQAVNQYEKITLDSGALFAHNKTGFDQISEVGRRQIYDLAIKLRGLQQVENITISGHSDITNSTQIPSYNDKLSLARATAVRDYLAELGLNVSRVSVIGMGARQPVETSCVAPVGTVQTPVGLSKGRANDADMNAFRACLLPNRRVEIEIFGHPSNDKTIKMADAPAILVLSQ